VTERIEEELRNWFGDSKKTVVAGIGNIIRTDDNVGLRIVELLEGKLSKQVLLLEAETVPESYIIDIEEFAPSHVLLIDAAFLGLKPGEASLVDAEKIENYSAITTHMLPLKVFCEYIKQVTGTKIALLLVQPRSTEFGEGLTPAVEKAARRLAKVLLKVFG